MAIKDELSDEQVFFGLALLAIALRRETLIGPYRPEGAPAAARPTGYNKHGDEIFPDSFYVVDPAVNDEARALARTFVAGIEEIGKQSHN